MRREWSKGGFTSSDFGPNDNVGVLLGPPSGDLVDLDLDCAEALTAARRLAPPTGLVWGREGARGSHRGYICPGTGKTSQRTDPLASGEGGMLVELRADGAQTLVPPSVHPSGESYVWDAQDEPAVVPAEDLARSVDEIAAAALLARYWPGKGQRHRAALALCGVLLRGGRDAGEVRALLAAICEAAGDEEWRDRGRNVDSTARRLREGKTVYGGVDLRRLLPDVVVSKALEWLGVPSAGAEAQGVLVDRVQEHTVAAWARREALPPPLLPVPDFEPGLMPECFRDWVTDAATRFQVPIEYIGVPAIVAAGSVLGRSVALRPRRRDDWAVIPNLWGAIVGEPGLLKTAALKEGLSPLHRLAKHAHEQSDPTSDFADRESVRVQIEALRAQFRQDSKKGNGAEEEAEFRERLTALLEQERELVTGGPRRYVTNDSTTERLHELVSENPRGVLVYRDELVAWIRSFEKPGREGDRQFYLEAWDGDSSHTSDRISRGVTHVDGLCISIMGGIQPGPLQDLVRDATRSRGDQGLLARIQLIVWPDVAAEFVDWDVEPDADARSRAWAAFEGLDALQPDNLGAFPTEGGVPYLRFDSAAQEEFADWRSGLERRVRGEVDSPALRAHLSKYRSLVPSLSLIDHALRVVDGADPGPVPVESLRRAIAWAVYLEAHAHRVYGGALHAGHVAGRALARRIEAGEIRHEMSVREVQRHCWSGLTRAEDIKQGLEFLESLGWVRVEDPRPGTPGRPTSVILLPPELRSRA